jgi:hypothetical protein
MLPGHAHTSTKHTSAAIDFNPAQDEHSLAREQILKRCFEKRAWTHDLALMLAEVVVWCATCKDLSLATGFSVGNSYGRLLLVWCCSVGVHSGRCHHVCFKISSDDTPLYTYVNM